MGCLFSHRNNINQHTLYQAEKNGFQQVSTIGYHKNWTNWQEIIKPDNNTLIGKAISIIENERKLLITILVENISLPQHIAVIIGEYFPSNDINKISFLSTFDNFFQIQTFTEKCCVIQRCQTNIDRFINKDNKELFQSFPSFKRETEQYPKQFKYVNPSEILDEIILEIYWYRTSIKQEKHKNTFKHHPSQPSDIFGKFKNGNYFYYKDGHPTLMNQKSYHHFTYFTFIGDTIKTVLNQMDKRDIKMLIENEKHWKPDLNRCSCWICNDYLKEEQ